MFSIIGDTPLTRLTSFAAYSWRCKITWCHGIRVIIFTGSDKSNARENTDKKSRLSHLNVLIKIKYL
jgi:hypothetical protein